MSSDKDSKPSLSKIPSGVLSRGFALARLSVNAGSRYASHKLSHALAAGDTAATEAFNKLLLTQARLLADELGQLKGSVMKVGQMLSMYGEHFLPPEVNQVLKSLQFQSPPLDWKAIQAVLVRELGHERLEELEIQTNAMASASLGQVHEALIKTDGRRLALKIQYPGVDKAIESDLKSLRTLFAVAQLFPQLPQLDAVFEEVQTMFWEEIDYRKELANTCDFRKALADDKRFVVPEAFPRYSTARVLATALQNGEALDSEPVQSLPQTRRDQIALAALDVFFLEFFNLGMVQTDPHLGNYRVQLDEKSGDRLVLFDFGAVRRFSPEFVTNYKEMIRGALSRDARQLQDAAIRLAFLREDDPVELKARFAEFCFLIVEPFQWPDVTDEARPWFTDDGLYDFRASDLPKRLTTQVGRVITSFKLRTPPQEVVFLDRKLGGVYVMMSVLGAKLNARERLEKILSR